MNKVLINSKSTINYKSTTFTLRGIIQQDLINGYIKGEYKNIVIENIKNKKSKLSSKTFTDKNEKLTDNPNNKKFHINNNSVKQIVNTTNQDLYELVLKNGDPMPIIQFNCFYCRASRNQVSLGFPLIIEVQLDKYIFFMDEPYYCNFNCLYSGCTEKYKDNNDEYELIEGNIKFLFSLIHPNKELTFAKDWRLHEVNHGPLNDEEFNNNELKFIKISSIIMLPVKRQYLSYKSK